MTALRTAHDPEPDVLRGKTLDETKEEAARLTAKALRITEHLARLHYAEDSVVASNLENERNGLELEAFDLLSRIAEYEGQIQHIRAPRVLPFGERRREPRITKGCGHCGALNILAADLTRCRLCGHDLTPKEEACSGCGYCKPDENLHCPKCCELGFPF